ncbi:MAG: hypothetical protein CFE45_11070 [Burkholderiales bacterium PBB5]|nr:MAG: hypothetical protein CFE45_11070 [Burkholderiales bacterium PBB5]
MGGAAAGGSNARTVSGLAHRLHAARRSHLGAVRAATAVVDVDVPSPPVCAAVPPVPMRARASPMSTPANGSNPSPPAALGAAMLRRVFQISPTPIVLSELHGGRLVSVNPAMVRLSGHALADLLDQQVVDTCFWDSAEDRARLVARVLAEGTVADFATVWRTRERHRLSMLLSASSFTQDGVLYLVTMSSDVTERERRRLQFEAMLNNAMVGIAFTRNGRYQSANACYERMFGWAPGALIGRGSDVLWPDAAAHALFASETSTQLARGEAVALECELQRADGSHLWCAVRARAVDPVRPARGGTIWIVEDITERRLAQQALAAAKEDAEAASRAKSAFLANTSHEIRTPLSGLLGLVRLALQPGTSPERQRECLERIQDSAQALAGTITDILDLSKIEAGKLSVDLCDHDLHDLLASIQRGYATLAEAKGLYLQFVCNDDVPHWVRSDPGRLRQILGNFLGNALKFTEHGHIRVHVCVPRPLWLRLEVEDTGPGIAADVQQRLFKPFTQADDSVTRRYGGSGLGLSICHELAQLMGGSVGVRSQPGAGARFWAEIPFTPAQPVATVDDHQRAVAETLRGAQVLLVEDDAVNALITEAALQHWGVQVQLATNGHEALAACRLRSAPLDAVLMDLHMPGMGGTEAAALLRQRYSREALPIIALSAGALVSQREAALACGMNDFLSKPLDLARLSSALAHWVGVARGARVAGR